MARDHFLHHHPPSNGVLRRVDHVPGGQLGRRVDPVGSNPIQGWASLALMLTTFSAINMVSLGVIGEYIGKIYKEVKRRPRYIIETTTTHGG